MSDLKLFIRCTHSGVYPDGRPNTASVQIPDLDTGLDYQHRKVPCYVPAGSFIDIPASGRSLLSFYSGGIKRLVNSGVITARLFSQPESYTNSNIPAANLYPSGTQIWNSDDRALNISDGTSWLTYGPLADKTQGTTFWVDETNGSNSSTNDGSQLRPFKTVEEVGRRIPNPINDITIKVTGNVSAIYLFMRPLRRNRITIEGVATTLATGTSAVVTDPSPSTNVLGTMTATGIASWVPYVQKIVEADGGTGVGSVCWSTIMADTAGTATCAKFIQYSTGSIPGVIASTGISGVPNGNVRVLSLPQVTGPIYIDVGQGSLIFVKMDRTTANPINPVCTCAQIFEVACLATVNWLGQFNVPRGSALSIGCCIPGNGTQTFSVTGLFQFVGGVSFRTLAATVYGTHIIFGGLVCYGAGAVLGNFSPAGGGAVVASTLNGGNFAQGLGIFNGVVAGSSNPSGDGLVLWNGAKFGITGSTAGLWGSGNLGRGVSLNGQGTMLQIVSGYTPNITGVGGDIRFLGGGNRIPPPSGDPATFPASAPCDTWSQFNAAPFSRAIFDYYTGSGIYGN